MLSQSAGVPEENPSPFTILNNRLAQQNAETEDLIGRLRNRLHKLSNTNVPTDNLANKESSGGIPPFQEGQLMNYHHGLEIQSRLIYALQEQVIKLESLI